MLARPKYTKIHQKISQASTTYIEGFSYAGFCVSIRLAVPKLLRIAAPECDRSRLEVCRLSVCTNSVNDE